MEFKNKTIKKILDKIIKFIEFLRLKTKINSLYPIKRIFTSINTKIIFLVEDADWAINWVGKNIVNNLQKFNLFNAEIDRVFHGRNKIIHYGSINCLIRGDSIIKIYNSNKNILSFFHIYPDMEIEKFVPYLDKKIDLIHTSNDITKKKLCEMGFKENKIVTVPLGVNLTLFKNYDRKMKLQLKKQFKLPQDKTIIGSFQKDGVGWGDGLEPKLIKGPDIFCKVVRKLKEKSDIHIFLTGPARGYVKKRLEEYNIPYTHIFLNNYLEMVQCYNAIDLYIITSRAEGGPLALLECMATGVPIVSTKVGMAPEIIKNGINGFLADINNIEQLYQYSNEIITNSDLKVRIIENSFKIVKSFSWEKISMMYYKKLYKKLLF